MDKSLIYCSFVHEIRENVDTILFICRPRLRSEGESLSLRDYAPAGRDPCTACGAKTNPSLSGITPLRGVIPAPPAAGQC